MKLINKKIITIALAIVILHFVLTSAAGYYIALRVGREMGKMVAEGLDEIWEVRQKGSPQKIQEAAQRIIQDIKVKREALLKKWEIPTIAVSLPVRYFLEPLLNEADREATKKVLSKEITVEQFHKRERLMNLAVNLVNSLTLGLLVYAILIIINLKSKPAKQPKRSRRKPGRKGRARHD
jgi:hypothetical protein